jgi:pyruvate dehydrogenase E2 component (dihydrolipoamide acetyltransferase)
VSIPPVPPMSMVDYSDFGPVREEPLTRIQKVSGPALHRSWLNVPHVTQYDESDVTELERFRRDRRVLADERGVKLSPLLFVMKGAVRVLEEFPMFRSSLAPEADRLIVKDYFHLGIAVDTDQGLVVPVIRDVDRKGIFELAGEVNEIAERARSKKLRPDDLKGACFTISSLGGIGGTGFSPIVNAPEVAILGLSKTRTQPVWHGPSPLDLPQDEPSSGSEQEFAGGFEPRLVMPFSLSYDHRVIDGASAVRFTTRLARVLSDPAQLLL